MTTMPPKPITDKLTSLLYGRLGTISAAWRPGRARPEAALAIKNSRLWIAIGPFSHGPRVTGIGEPLQWRIGKRGASESLCGSGDLCGSSRSADRDVVDFAGVIDRKSTRLNSSHLG